MPQPEGQPPTTVDSSATLFCRGESEMRTLPNTVIEQATIQGSPGSALLRRSFRKTFPPAVRGEGAYLWDARGKQYLDFAVSSDVYYIGPRVCVALSAMSEQPLTLDFVHSSQL